MASIPVVKREYSLRVGKVTDVQLLTFVGAILFSHFPDFV